MKYISSVDHFNMIANNQYPLIKKADQKAIGNKVV